MDDDAVVYYEDLEREFGIKISRTHLKRLEDAGKCPQRIKPSSIRGSRFWYPRREWRDFVQGKWKPKSA
jgi:hypothetical protein